MKLEKKFNNKVPHKIRITFTKSRSKYFDSALYNAEKIQGYKTLKRVREQIHIVEIENDIFTEELKNLLTYIFSWKNTTISINGLSIDGVHGFYSTFMDAYDCYKYHLDDDYCIGKLTPSDDQRYFGCKHEWGVSLVPAYSYYNLHTQWYQFGKLSSDSNYFDINKKDIKDRLHKSTIHRPCILCPFFSWKRLENGVDKLPDRIDLTKDKRFIIKYSELSPSKAIGIQMKESAYYDEARDDEAQESNNQDIRYVPKTKYSDIAAQDKVLEEVENVIGLPIKHPEYYTKMNIESHKGILLYGPPGNGKTLIAKAVANEANAHLELINGPEILAKYVGESEEKLRSIFERAEKYSPSIILIDEIDSIFSSRDMIDHQHEIAIISQFLVLLDGLEPRGKVAIIGTTNRIKAVDPAIRRPGRFDYHIEVPSPDINGIMAILETHLSKSKTEKPLNLMQIAKMIDGFSGAEAAALCREAGLIAIKKALKSKIKAEDVFISNQNLIDAVDSIKSKRFIN